MKQRKPTMKNTLKSEQRNSKTSAMHWRKPLLGDVPMKLNKSGSGELMLTIGKMQRLELRTWNNN